MIRLSDKSERDRIELRKLWETCFDDTDAFVDYYFSEIFPMNEIIVMEESGNIIGMVHLNPYFFVINDQRVKTYFIVGVAVHEAYRRRKCAFRMLEYACDWMRKEGVSFTYLWPADRRYYSSSGFADVSQIVQYRISMQDLEGLLSFCECGNTATDLIQEEFIYPSYSSDDINRIHAELSSESGIFATFPDEEAPEGYFSLCQNKDVLEVHHMVPFIDVGAYFSFLLSYICQLQRKEERFTGIKEVCFYMDSRLWKHLSFPIGNVKEDHVYMIKKLDETCNIDLTKILFTEIV